MSEWEYCPCCGGRLEPYEDAEGYERHRCTAEECDFIHYDNPTPVVAAIVQYGDDVTLARNVGWPEDWFGLVTGFLEKGETPEAGMKRELREELEVDAEIVGFVGHYPFEEMNQLILAYHVTIDEDPTAGPELAEIKSVPIDDLKPWPMGTGHAVRDWLERR